MADQDGVRSVAVQLTERLVLDRERRDRFAVHETKSFAQHKLARRSGDECVLQQLRHSAGENSSFRSAGHDDPQNDVDDHAGKGSGEHGDEDIENAHGGGTPAEPLGDSSADTGDDGVLARAMKDHVTLLSPASVDLRKYGAPRRW